MIAAAPGTGLPVPTPLLSMSVLDHGGGSQNAGVAHDNYIDRTAAYFWFYAIRILDGTSTTTTI
jgi:hypothetical protein